VLPTAVPLAGPLPEREVGSWVFSQRSSVQTRLQLFIVSIGV
jgi:hypothetical protein